MIQRLTKVRCHFLFCNLYWSRRSLAIELRGVI
jgi:hypothetical protein